MNIPMARPSGRNTVGRHSDLDRVNLLDVYKEKYTSLMVDET